MLCLRAQQASIELCIAKREYIKYGRGTGVPVILMKGLKGGTFDLLSLPYHVRADTNSIYTARYKALTCEHQLVVVTVTA
jgi:hypothetical protein